MNIHKRKRIIYKLDNVFEFRVLQRIKFNKTKV